MKDPLLSPYRKQPTQFQQVNDLFTRIFNPESFSIMRGIQQLKEFGGITSVMSLLETSHREGLSLFADNKQRIQVFGQNVLPKSQNIIRKAISNERDFTINLLLYIITLRFFIKILFIRDGVIVESIWDEIVSFVLLLVMISLKAMVNLQFYKLDQTEKKYHDEKWIKVRRDGEILETMEKFLMVGDIVIIEADNDIIRIDGLILSSNEFYVSESQTILKQQSKKKFSILNLKESQHNEAFDPFLLSGSTVSYGSAEILVCRIGQSCTFRLKNQKFQQFSTQVTPLIHSLKKVLNYVENFSNVVAFISSGYFAIYFLHQGIINKNLSWFTFLQILKKFSSLIGFVCLLQKLKIVRSLQFYLQSFRSDKCFRIKNKCTLQKLNQVDLFIIDKQAIKIHDTERGFIIPKISFLSYLNQHYKLKIVTKQAKHKVMEEFDIDDVDSRVQQKGIFYQDIPSQSSEDRLKRLKDCLFITECNRKKLQSELIPIFEGLQYQIAYLYKFKVNQESRTSKDILSIAFAEQSLQNSHFKKQNQVQEWVRIKNTSIAQDHIKEIMQKSIRFNQLYNVYMVQFVNNIIIFGFLSWISIYRTYSIDFYWSLTIINIARFIFFRIYRMIALDKGEPRLKMRSHRRIIKLNIYLFFYYLYVLTNIEEKINVVMFFMCNTILRTEILLIKVQNDVSIRNIIKNNLIVFLLLGCYILFKFLNDMPIHEELVLVQYVLGLSFLFVLYGFVH